jgi:hypothetical protein
MSDASDMTEHASVLDPQPPFRLVAPVTGCGCGGVGIRPAPVLPPAEPPALDDVRQGLLDAGAALKIMGSSLKLMRETICRLEEQLAETQKFTDRVQVQVYNINKKRKRQVDRDSMVRGGQVDGAY